MTENLRRLTYRDVLNVHVPSEIIDGGIRKTITFRRHTPGGGAGMGEYPATVMLVLSDGKVYEWSAWHSGDQPQLVSYHKNAQKDISF